MSKKRNNVVRQAIASVIAMTFVGTLLGASPAGASTPTAVRDRLAVIGDEYEVGEELSAEDAAFVKAHAMSTADSSATRGTASNCFRKSGASGAGVVDGCHGSVIGASLTVRWQTGYTATGNSSVTKIKAAEHIRAYGLVGSSGVGLVYSSNPSSTVNGRTNTFSRSGSFTALAAYVTVQYDATFYKRNGSFNVTGG
ncbi:MULTISPECIES: hypothetical protein [unclassified Curtobacterium]|uniref:hypothetical protein n=1 Tax=unclassified Curtobacterium TaxID=257496 RepID=UPI0039B05903